MNRKTLLLYVALPVVVIAGAATYHRGQRNSELSHQATVKSEGIVPVTLVPVQERSFHPAVAFTGTLLAVNRAELKAEVTGRVTRVAVQEGDTVAAGALLGAQDEDDYLLGVQAAEAQLAQAKAQALQAARDNERSVALLEKRSITRQAAQQAETAYNATKAAAQAAESNLGMARLRLKKARLVAPFAGQVARRAVQPGEMLNPGQTAFEVVDNRKLEIRADLPTEAMASVKTGQKATFRAVGLDRPVEGKVAQVSPSLSQDGRTLRVRIEVANLDGQLKGGLFVEGVILGEGEAKRPALPATLLKAQDRDAELFVAEESVARRRKVVLGVEQDGFRPVTGLAVGVQVIDSGKDLVGEGSRLRVITAVAPATSAPSVGGK
ncbi:efflux RND transporter periplasmic adaptor subunit [Geothrix sp. PMB-07]|uniref:efflux RND transporter periplasmic adaptor subunit n=1 Tax=Geothrix sp. PMB-07 TaxID=3068640 RepID=UPI0027406020|nr:efflux RND transporter periplasmic adaptor subunit [Geothrix sp. PMB-07]WLT32511.1 efflux RND transporter periplasmic adaptor subunit [Geothrix sp. PMB-07]